MNLIEPILPMPPRSRDPARHPYPSRAVLRGAAHFGRDRQGAHRLGIPIHRGLGKTGVVGIVRTGTSDRAVGLRADIDALPMTEHNHFAHASRHHGRCTPAARRPHRDAVAAAKYLAMTAPPGTARVYLVFQPAEGGAAPAR